MSEKKTVVPRAKSVLFVKRDKNWVHEEYLNLRRSQGPYSSTEFGLFNLVMGCDRVAVTKYELVFWVNLGRFVSLK